MNRIFCHLLVFTLFYSPRVYAQLNATVLPVIGTSQGFTGLTAVKDKDNFLVLTGNLQIQQLFKTTNGGQQFYPVTGFPASFNPYRFNVSGNTIFAGGNGIYKSTDFGDSWVAQPVAAIGENYEELTLMPNGKIWLVGYSSSFVRLYETDTNFSYFSQKCQLPFPHMMFNLSDVSCDTVYFSTRDNNGIRWLYKTVNNGGNWTQSDILEALDSNSCFVSYIKYHSATRASIFGYDFGSINKDYFTTDGFDSIVFDSLCAIAHPMNTVIDWVTCNGYNYLLYDANENSVSGVQPVTMNADGSATLGTYEFISWTKSNSISHNNDVLTVAYGDTSVQLVQGFCQTNSISGPHSLAITTVVFPNPTTGYAEIKTNSGISKWDVFDVMGRGITAGKDRHVNLSSLPTGMYMLKLVDQNGTVTTHRLMKE